MRMINRTVVLCFATALLSVPATVAVGKDGADDAPAHDIGDDKGGQRDDERAEKRVAGSCTGASSAKLKAKPDDGRIETEFEVDQNRNGVRWQVRIRRDAKLVVSTRATTRAPSGSFSVERRIADPAGRDRITARAVSPSGEVCRATVTL